MFEARHRDGAGRARRGRRAGARAWRHDESQHAEAARLADDWRGRFVKVVPGKK